MAKVLVVNHDADTLGLIQDLLERRGYQVAYTLHPEKVTELVHQFKPDVILVDIMQQRVMTDLKADKDINTIPVLLMAGHNNQYDMPEIRPADVIEKPFTPEMLVKKIKKIQQSFNKMN